MIVIPLRNMVLIQPDAVVTESAGGILLPKEATERPARGRVCRTGPLATAVKEGDAVFHGKYAGQPVEGEAGIKLLIMSEDDIMAVDESGT